MPFTKGHSGNPKGKPKGSKDFAVALLKAIKRVEKEQKINLLKHFVEQAIVDNKVLIALVKKFMPDLRQTDLNLDGELTINGLADIIKKSVEAPKIAGD